MSRRGHTLAELITVMGLGLLVLSLVGTLYLGVNRVVEAELARSELLAGAREVLHPLKGEVREAWALSVSPTRLSLMVRGQSIEYVSVSGGVSRRSRGGSRLLGAPGLAVQFRPLGARAVEVKLQGKRDVGGRTFTLAREVTVARRVP